MIKRIYHPRSGWTHAYTEKELTDYINSGWVIDEIPAVETSEVVEKKIPSKGKACTKCGKIMEKGWYMHDKHCRGEINGNS